MQHSYIADKEGVDLATKKVPSTPMGVFLCGGVAGTLALKILLGRTPLDVAPTSIHFDAYLGKLKKKRVWFGYRNPLQKLKVLIALFLLKKSRRSPQNGGWRKNEI